MYTVLKDGELTKVTSKELRELVIQSRAEDESITFEIDNEIDKLKEQIEVLETLRARFNEITDEPSAKQLFAELGVDRYYGLGDFLEVLHRT